MFVFATLNCACIATQSSSIRCYFFLCIKSRTTSKQVVAWNITEAWLTKTKLYNSILACIKLGWQFLKVEKKNRDKIMQKINEWRMTMRFLNYLHVYTRSRDSNIGSTFEICKRSSCFLKVKQMNLELCLVLWKSVDRHAHYYFFTTLIINIYCTNSIQSIQQKFTSIASNSIPPKRTFCN